MNANLLVVDDESQLRHLIRAALEPLDYKVFEAATAEAALQVLEAEKIDLALIDWVLPARSGLDLLEEMRTRNPELRTILISGFGTIDVALRALNSGARDFLRKPFTPEMLHAAVNAALQRERAASPVNTVRREFTRTNINGFSFELERSEVDPIHGDITCRFEVVQDYADVRHVSVTLPSYVQELAMALMDFDKLPCGQRFWLKMCEEELANVLWRDQKLPVSGKIRIEDISESQRRWLESVTTVCPTSNEGSAMAVRS